jgi:hypothetical protein
MNLRTADLVVALGQLAIGVKALGAFDWPPSFVSHLRHAFKSSLSPQSRSFLGYQFGRAA